MPKAILSRGCNSRSLKAVLYGLVYWNSYRTIADDFNWFSQISVKMVAVSTLISYKIFI